MSHRHPTKCTVDRAGRTQPAIRTEQCWRLPTVGHFLAWSRWPNDAVENLVVADRCNGAKSDHLVAPEHLGRWFVRVAERAGDLADLATQAGWSSDHLRSLGLVRSTYGHLAPGTPLWVRDREFTEAAGPLVFE